MMVIMRKQVAAVLYGIANTICIAADGLWTSDDYWRAELEQLNHEVNGK
jgi:hypothetical protein